MTDKQVESLVDYLCDRAACTPGEVLRLYAVVKSRQRDSLRVIAFCTSMVSAGVATVTYDGEQSSYFSALYDFLSGEGVCPEGYSCKTVRILAGRYARQITTAMQWHKEATEHDDLHTSLRRLHIP